MEPLAKYEDEAEQCAEGRSVVYLAAGLQGEPSRFEVRPVRVWTLREPCELSSAACGALCVRGRECVEYGSSCVRSVVCVDVRE